MDTKTITTPETRTDPRLEEIIQRGITVDIHQIKADMCTQFADYREWIREYAVNASDAGAGFCWISGWEDEKTLTIVVEDNGHGMDRQEVLDFFSLYRSVKRKKVGPIVGFHGIGKLSVAAIPGQVRFLMRSSTGRECFIATTGSLLSEEPIKIQKIDPPPEAGTRFEITFEKRQSLERELASLTGVLDRYLRHFPFHCLICLSDGKDPGALENAVHIQGQWLGSQARGLEKRYRFSKEGQEIDAVFDLDETCHEIYQNYVYITNRYDLLFAGTGRKVCITHLKIRVNSDVFRLPFGRHCLTNEEDLPPIAAYLRRVMLPEYVREVMAVFNDDSYAQLGMSLRKIVEFMASLIIYDTGHQNPWCDARIFSFANFPRMSLNELRTKAAQTRVIYLQDSRTRLDDVGEFEVPVLRPRQPELALAALQKVFRDRLVPMTQVHKTVVEVPETPQQGLSPGEQKFQSVLGVHPAALDYLRKAGRKMQVGGTGPQILPTADAGQKHGLSKEHLEQANRDICAIHWKLGHLILADTLAPCRFKPYLLKENQVILNLHHKEIKDLARLSEKTPLLASHFALCLVIEDKRLLVQWPARIREALIMVDAIHKCGNPSPDSPRRSLARAGEDFTKDIDDVHQWF